MSYQLGIKYCIYRFKDKYENFFLRHIPQIEQHEGMDQGNYILDEKDARKSLFKKRSTSSTCAVSNYELVFML